jgi:hypothetical protein
MKRFLFIFTLALFTSVASAQEDSIFRKIRIITGDIVDFTVDNLDNIYLLNSRNQLSKYDANGDSVAVYNDVKKYGKVTLLDVSNPLRLLLYYSDFATVVILDRFLNARHTIDLRKHNILQVRAIAQSYDNKIWVYDELENKLKKIDEDGRLIFETADFRQMPGGAIAPVKIFDEDKNIYIYDSLRGVYVFDYYGGLRHNILITQWRNLKLSGKFIFGSQSDTLRRYEISKYRVDEWKMPLAIGGSNKFNFSSTRLYALKPSCLGDRSCLYIYQIL